MAEPILLPDDRLHARVLYLNRLVLWPWWRFPRLQDAFWRIYWHDRDGASLVHAGREITIPARRAVMVPADVAVATRPAPDVVQWYAHIEVLGLPPRASALIATAPFVAPEDAALGALLDPLLAGFERLAPLAALAAVKAAFWRILQLRTTTLPAAAAEALLANVRGGGRVALALRGIEDAPGQAWSVERLAALTGLSPGRFAHVFRAEVGMPPWRWILDRRLAQAAQRLLHGDEDLPALAAQLGFTDRHHLSRAFSRRYGNSPMAYRRQARSAALGPDGGMVPAPLT